MLSNNLCESIRKYTYYIWYVNWNSSHAKQVRESNHFSKILSKITNDKVKHVPILKASNLIIYHGLQIILVLVLKKGIYNAFYTNLLIIARFLKQPKHPQELEWINKLWYTAEEAPHNFTQECTWIS